MGAVCMRLLVSIMTDINNEILLKVWPIVAYHVQEVNVNSQRLVEEHRVGFGNERQLHQVRKCSQAGPL